MLSYDEMLNRFCMDKFYSALGILVGIVIAVEIPIVAAPRPQEVEHEAIGLDADLR